MAINQGDLYWVTLAGEPDVEPTVPHPYVIVQENVFNHSRIDTVVACALTSNLRRSGETPGNVLLDEEEGNLPRRSVVEISKVTTLQKSQLSEYIGTLSPERVQQILGGMRFLQRSAFDR